MDRCCRTHRHSIAAARRSSAVFRHGRFEMKSSSFEQMGRHIKPWTRYETSRVMREPAFSICENKGTSAPLISLHTCKIDSTITLLPNSEILASGHLLWLYSSVCIEPCRKYRRQIFSQQYNMSLCETKPTKFPWRSMRPYKRQGNLPSLFRVRCRHEESYVKVLCYPLNLQRRLPKLI